MKKIEKYEADDGTVWDTVKECAFREWIVKAVEKAISPLGDAPVGMAGKDHETAVVACTHRGLRKVAYLCGLITPDRGGEWLTEYVCIYWLLHWQSRPKYKPLLDAYWRMGNITEHGCESIMLGFQPNFVTSEHMDWEEKPNDPLRSTTA